jgi:hypothetical protein
MLVTATGALSGTTVLPGTKSSRRLGCAMRQAFTRTREESALPFSPNSGQLEGPG